jgi:ribosome biogenesis protein ENP2
MGITFLRQVNKQCLLLYLTYFIFQGSYKPTIKCFDLNELSIKFERCLDADVIKMCVLGDDFTKVIIITYAHSVQFMINYLVHFVRRATFC